MMAMLQKQTAIVTLKGLNQKSPGTIGAPGELELAENLIAKRGGQGSFEFVRRNGMTQIANTTTQADGTGTGARLFSAGDALLLETARSIWQYDAITGAPAQPWPNTNIVATARPLAMSSFVSGNAAPVSTGSSPVSTLISSMDCAVSGNNVCYVYLDSSVPANVVNRIEIYDAVNAQAAAYTNLVPVGILSNLKVVSLNGIFYVFYKDGNDIKAQSFLATTGGFAVGGATIIAAASCLAGTDYDIQAGFDSSHIALMYRKAAGTHTRCLVNSTTFAITSSTDDAVAADQPNVGMCWIPQDTFGASLYYATINAANGAKLQTVSATTLANTATVSDAAVTAGLNFTGYITGTAITLVFELTGSANYRHKIKSTNGTTTTFINYGCGLTSRCFYMQSLPYVLGLYASSATATARRNTYFLFSLINKPVGTAAASGAIVGIAFPGNAGSQDTLHLSTAATDSSGKVHVATLKVSSIDTTAGAITPVFSIADVSFQYCPATLGGGLAFGGQLIFPGAQLWKQDAARAYMAQREFCIPTAPEPVTLVEGAAASGSIPVGTRSIIASYEYTDTTGQLYRTDFSTPVAITTANVNSSVQITIDTNKTSTASILGSQVTISVWRTPNGGDGSLYYRTSQSLVGSASTDTVTFIDMLSEAQLVASEPYTPSSAGGELENVAPGTMNVICEHKNRIFGVLSEQPHRIQFSKEYVVGNVIGFFDGFIINTPEATGPIYALASMDGHLVAIKRDCIYVISGDFPDATGGGPQIPLPTVLPTGVGTTAPRSVVVTSHGVMFHSIAKGFWLLNRSLQVSYIGAQVELQANTGAVVISGASVMSDKTQVRWTSEGGTSFVLDTYFLELGTPVWTTFTGQPCVHSVNHLGRWYHLTSDGKLKVENAIWCDGTQPGETGTFTPGVEYFGKLTVSDINFGGILGFVRCWRGQLLGEWFAAHKLKVTLQRNHRNVNENPFTFDATANPDPYMMEFRPQIQKATSLTVTIEETTTGSQQTQGAAWTALAFSVGTKPGVSRLPQTKTMVGS